MAGAKHVYDTLIVGTGFTGVGTAIKLTQSGVDDFVMLERHERVGGTWRVPTYQMLKLHARMVVKPDNPYHWIANPMVWASDRYPKKLLSPIPSWFKELTHEPAA